MNQFCSVYAHPVQELIETLWNVNVDTGALRNSITHELIETLWNVNAEN